MDTNSALIAGIIIAICVIPFVWMSINRKQKEKNKLDAFKAFAKEHNCTITEHEFCGDFIIGIDSANNYVFFNKYSEDGVYSQFIDLATVKNCAEQTKLRTIREHENSRTITERVDLIFDQKEAGRTVFNLYDDEVNMQLTGELIAADKWAARINKCLA